MELEFDAAAKKMRRERDARKMQLEKRKIAESKAKAAAEEAEKRVQEAAEKRRIERRMAEEEAQLMEAQNEGIRYEAKLQCMPLVKADTNRVVLPKSALEALDAQRALDRVGGPLTFQLSIENENGRVCTTHCGVDDFTAEEGTIKIPPSVAMSLSKENGVDSLVNKMVKVRFVILNQYKEIKVSFQPRGEGFHADDKDVVNIDIKAVLLRTLRDALTLTEGDWIPIRHEGKTFDLVVKSIFPEHALKIVNTDVEVELLPSENVALRQKIEETRSKWVADRSAWLDQKKGSLLPEAPTGSKPTLRVRMMNGQNCTRRFTPQSKFGEVLDWVEVNLPAPKFEDIQTLPDDLHIPFALVRAGLPGKQESFGFSSKDVTLSDLGIVSDRESFMAQWAYADLASVDNAQSTSPMEISEKLEVTPPNSDIFSHAVQAANQQLDEVLEASNLDTAMSSSEGGGESQSQEQVDKVHVFHALIAQGIDPQKAAKAAQAFSSQIVTLETMGFMEHSKTLELLEKYQGRLERVVNCLAGAD